jgi:hypothetical protein
VGVDLIQADGEQFQFTSSGWHRVLVFAQAHGWRAPDSVAEPERFSQEVAETLADAVERGIGDGATAEIAQRVADELTQLLVVTSGSSMFFDDPVEFSTRGVEHWRAFVRFARRGGFDVR